MTRVRNDLFDSGQGLSRGRSLPVEACWYLLKCAVFLNPLPVPVALKRILLRLFGAKVGRGVIIKPRVNIHFPWKLSLGDHSWIGEEVFILNLEPVSVGRHCCVSQRAFLCTGNHDYRQREMPYCNRPITLEDGVWIGAQSFVGPGVTVGTDSVVAAGSVVTKALPPGMVCRGNPCLPSRPRWSSPEASTLEPGQAPTVDCPGGVPAERPVAVTGT
jgi:putative colanic acid biosynthesis acetyltransferase WcaF